jgi:hypothetical protein
MFSEAVVDTGDPDPLNDPFIKRAINGLPGFREPAYRPASQMAGAK